MLLSVYLKLLFTVSVWGGAFIAIKVAVSYMNPLSVMWTRTFIGLFVLYLFIKFRRVSFTIPRPALLGCAFLGFIAVFLHQWLQAYALCSSKASTATWIIATAPIFIAILGRLFLKEKLSFLKIIGIFSAFLGVLFVISDGDILGAFKGTSATIGDLIMLLTAVNWAVYSVCSRYLLKRYNKTPQTIFIFYVMLFGFLYATFVLPFIPDALNSLNLLSKESALLCSILFLGIFSTGMAYAFWYDALCVIEASKVGVFMYLQPIIGMVVAFLVLNEPITKFVIFGGLLIITGVYMVNK